MNWTEIAKSSPVVGLSFLIICMTCGLEAYGMFRGFSDKVDDVVLGRILGAFDAYTMLVLGYWFGTTKSSHEKDQTIAGQLNAQTDKPPA